MRIAMITAGAAGMYCGSCLHDNTLARTMIAQGHDVALIPIYTPIRTDEQDVSIDRVFYGAINVFLEQKSALFRHTPWLVDRLFNGNGLLKWASSRGASIDARELGAMTLSVLQGEEGRQRKELEKLVAWLRDEFKPDLVQLPNSMLLGMARSIRKELGVPVLCELQGEDIFLDELREPYLTHVREELVRRSGDVDGYIVNSVYYRDHMASRFGLPLDKMYVVPLGIVLDDFIEDAPRDDDRPFTIGYLARICPEKGLHNLVAAFHELSGRVGHENVRLRIAGYLGERDREYKNGIDEQIRIWGLDDVVDDIGEVDHRGKAEFLENLHVFSVPTSYQEPKGLYLLEAWAAGLPVVQPEHGAFPELVRDTGGGLLVEPGSATALAGAIRDLMEDPQRRWSLGDAGREAVRSRYDAGTMAEETLKLYASFVENRAGRTPDAVA